MAKLVVTVTRDLPLPADAVFDALIDWEGHATWVPLTQVAVLSGDGGPGTVFLATSGLRPLALPDRMRVDALDRTQRTVAITKLGPPLTGKVRIGVTPTGPDACRVDWDEDIVVPRVPQVAAKPLELATAQSFRFALGRLAAQLAAG